MEPITEQAGPAGERPLGASLYTALLVALVAPSLNMTTLPPALPIIADYLGGGESGQIAAQRAQALPFLGLAAGGLLAGGVIARLGLKGAIMAAAAIFALGGLVAGGATGIALLYLGLLAVGLAGSVLSSALTTATGALYAGAGRARLLGIQTGLSDGAAIGAGITAAVLTQFWGWRAPFAIFVAFGIAILLLVGRAKLPQIEGQPRVAKGLLAAGSAAGSTYFCAFGAFFLLGTETALLPFRMEAHGLDTPASRAVVLTSVPVLAMLTSLGYGWARGRIADRWFILAATLASAAGYVGLALWERGLASITLAAMATGVGIGFTFPIVIRSAFRRTAPALHGFSMGLLNTAVFFGAFASPLLLGAFERRFGAEALFFMCGAAWLVVGLIAALRTWNGATPVPVSGARA